jgi:hypothetical protein
MAFAWDLFAEEIGRVGQRAGARVAQRGIDKRAEERAYRMHEEKLQIEQPFKELESEMILERQKELAKERTELQKGLEEWRGLLSRELDIFAGSEGYQKAIETARKEGGLSQVAVMRMEDSIMRARAGELPDLSDFEGLPPFDRLKIMDLLKQNQEIITKSQQKQQDLDMEAMALQNASAALVERRADRGLIDMQRWLNMRSKLDTAAEKAETTFDKYRTELLGELESNNKINAKGEAFATIGGKKKIKLINPETGEVNEKAKETFVSKYPRYRGRFKRLEVLRENAKARNEARDKFFGGEPTGVPTASNTWTGSDGKTYEIGKTYTIGGQKVKCIGENQFEPVK